MLVGLWAGRRCAAKYDLPDVFFERYWPVVAFPIFFSIWITWLCSHADTEWDSVLIANYVLLSIIPFPIAFIFSSLREELTNTKGILSVCITAFIIFAIPVWQIKLIYSGYREKNLPYGYRGPSIVDDSDFDVINENYLMNVLLPNLDFSPSLRLSEDLPKIDGATSFYPVHYAIESYGKRRIFRERVDNRVKFLAVESVAPTEENIRNKSYPFTVDVFIATAGTKNPHVQELIDWTLSPEGQALIEKIGYTGVEKRMEQ
jgi:hypothetical protein